MYILDEKEYITDILNTNKKPDDLSIGYLISLIARYYYDENRDLNDLVDIVKKRILSFEILGYQEYRFATKIYNTCLELYEDKSKTKFKELKYIPVYQSEIDVISKLSNDRQKKFLFTLYVLARYMDTDGWINKKNSKSLSEVFKLANISLTNDKKNELLNDLYSNGYIKFAKKVNNLNIKVDLIPDDNVVYKLVSFENIGNQYIGNFKKGYTQCKKCGKKIKTTANNKLYCMNCAKEVNKDKTKERMKILRNAKMFEADTCENR